MIVLSLVSQENLFLPCFARYFNPIGHSIMIEYEDAPGILAATTAILVC